MRRPRLLAAACLLVLSAAGLPSATAEDAATREFDQLRLELHVEPDLGRGVINGRMTLEFEALVEGLRWLRLHCRDTRVLAVVGEDAEPLTWSLDDGILQVDLARPLPRGQGSRVEVAYRATPRRGLYFHRPTPRHPKTPLLMYSQGQSNDNRHWIPCYDLPDDRMALDLYVTVPPELETVSNGRLVETEDTEDGRRTDHWAFADETPSYLISLVVGDLETVEDRWEQTTLEYTAVPGHAEELKTALGETPAMMAFYSAELDAPYPWDRYAQTFVWDFIYGGMENVTATTLNMRALHLPPARPNYSSEGLVAHELAHMWFGDLITCRTWDDIWLNEGFATYFTDLYFEHAPRAGRVPAQAAQPEPGLHGRHARTRRVWTSSATRAATARWSSPGARQYTRGAAILHMLRLELGDDLYREAIRTYVKRYRGRHGHLRGPPRVRSRTWRDAT